MAEKPILFSAPMIKAILSGRKIQTRRIIKPQPQLCSGCQSCEFRCDHFIQLIKCPYGNPKDILWVRETWRPALSETHECYAYRADLKYRCGKPIPEGSENINPWKPSIHMPRKASRITLEITDICIERLHDISEEDALAEGIEPLNSDGLNLYTIYIPKNNAHYNALTAKGVFRMLWESINGVESWDSNPWVWVVSFEKKC